MRTSLLLMLANRNVWRNKRRTYVLLLAVSASIWSMLIFGSLINGWSDRLRTDSINDLTGHLKLGTAQYFDDPSVTHSMSLGDVDLRSVSTPPKAIKGFTARVRVPAVISSEHRSQMTMLVGIDPSSERGLSFIADTVTAGRNLSSAEDNGILIGKELAERLRTAPGKRLVVVSQSRKGGVTDRAFEVVGVFNAERSSLELGYVFTGRRTAQRFLGLASDEVSELSVVLREPNLLTDLVNGLRSTGLQLDVRSWLQLQPLTAARLQMNEGVLAIWYVIAFVAMSFGLVNTLLMAVYERTREIALCQALGMRPRFMLKQILIESTILLFVGLLIGNAVALATLLGLGNGFDLSSFASGAELVGLGTTIYPVAQLSDWLSANFITVITGLLASLYPAWRASRRVPVEAINRT